MTDQEEANEECDKLAIATIGISVIMTFFALWEYTWLSIPVVYLLYQNVRHEVRLFWVSKTFQMSVRVVRHMKGYK